MSNQRNGDQREARLTLLPPTPAILKTCLRCCQGRKNRAEAHQFPDQTGTVQHVGEHLLATLDEMFSPGQEVRTRGVKPMASWLMYLSIARQNL